MQEVRCAGCVVLRPGKDFLENPEVLLIWTLDYTDPTLPKGRVEPGETAEDAARREVREETGCDVSITDPEPVTVDALLAAHPPVIRKVIDFYLAHPTSESFCGPLDPLIRRAAWVPVDQALRLMLREEEVTALLRCVRKAGDVIQGQGSTRTH